MASSVFSILQTGSPNPHAILGICTLVAHTAVGSPLASYFVFGPFALAIAHEGSNPEAGYDQTRSQSIPDKFPA